MILHFYPGAGADAGLERDGWIAVAEEKGIVEPPGVWKTEESR
jgi:hypothetical protein